MNIEKPTRVSWRGRQLWNGTKQETFQLLCPVEELKWAYGWAPLAVYAQSGVCEQDCIFLTPSKTKEGQENLWIVTKHRPQDYFVEMYQVLPEGVLVKLEIFLLEEHDNKTTAELIVTKTAYSDEGKDFVAQFTEEAFDAYMRGWETALNYYLDKGHMIPHPPV